jgi:cyclophilin family peptidyl-prolyl cis-trans isomerase
MRLLVILFIVVLSNNTFAQKQSKKDYLVTLSTEFGEMKIILFDETPKHKENFIKLVQSGFYNGTTFHRVIRDFMIQGGDPNSKDDIAGNEGTGGPGYTIPNEIRTDIKHLKGSLAAARMGDGVNPQRESSGSQFYIVHNASGTPFLDGAYTVFGYVVAGQDAIDAIALQPIGRADKPVKDIKMTVSLEEMSRKKISKKYGIARKI